jgi:hypothetical protein
MAVQEQPQGFGLGGDAGQAVAGLARSLGEHGLVDRVKFLVFPVVGGTGLDLAATGTLGNGTVELAYPPLVP